jgi:hypothetical protein
MVNAGFTMLAFAKVLLAGKDVPRVRRVHARGGDAQQGYGVGQQLFGTAFASNRGKPAGAACRLTRNLWTQETAQMATARTEPTQTKKSAAAPTAESAAEAATESAAAGQILAERYRDAAYQALTGKNGENVTAVMSASEAMFTGLAEMSQEMMDFAGARLRADMECAEDFSKVSSPEELFEKQCSFARRASQHYAEETSKLIGMMARIQQSCWAPMEQCTKQALQGLNGTEDDEKKK